MIPPIEPFSAILVPVVINIVTGPINIVNLYKRWKREPPINHDLQKAIKTAYLEALLDIAQEFLPKPFRLHISTKLDPQIRKWRKEIEFLKKIDELEKIDPPLKNTTEIEEVLRSHGQLNNPLIEELEKRLVSQVLQEMQGFPRKFQKKVKTDLFKGFYAHFVEQLKTNERAYRGFEISCLNDINASLTNLTEGQKTIIVTMEILLQPFGQSLSEIKDNLEKLIEREQLNSRKVDQLLQNSQRDSGKLDQILALVKPNETPENKLYQALLKLDYTKQANLFQEFVEQQQIGACLIHGAEGSGQRWLLNRLIQKIPNGNTSNYVKKVSFSQNTQRNSTENFFKEISRQLKIPSTSSLEEIFQEIVKLWQSQTVVFVFYNPHYLQAECHLEDMLRIFWEPLANLANAKGTTNDNFRLLLFLVDLDGCVDEWKITCTHNITTGWKPSTLIKFGKIEPLLSRDLSYWLEESKLDESLLKVTTTLVQDILDNSEGGVHEYVLEEICLRCNIKWEEQESKWLKY